MSQQSDDTGFWSGTNFGDLFETVVGGYVETERARAEAGSRTQYEDQNALINRPDHVTQRPNAQPSYPSSPSEVSAGSGQGSERMMLPGGLEVNRTAVYIVGAALAAAVVLKVAS